MKRIEDAPKELKDMFDKVFEKWWSELEPTHGETWLYDHRREVLEHFFLKGFDVAMATGGLPQGRKRTITNLIKLDGQIYAISNDGKLFINHYTRPEEWQAFPDLPQED